MTTEPIPAINMLLAIVGAFLAFLILVNLVIKIKNFRDDLDYINREIERTEGEEQKYWRHERLHLWLSLIFFFRQ